MLLDHHHRSGSHNVFLRDHCQCPACRHEITKQRLYDTYKVSSALFSCQLLALGLTWQHFFTPRFHWISPRRKWSRQTVESGFRGMMDHNTPLPIPGNGYFRTHTHPACSKKLPMLKIYLKRHYGQIRSPLRLLRFRTKQS